MPTHVHASADYAFGVSKIFFNKILSHLHQAHPDLQTSLICTFEDPNGGSPYELKLINGQPLTCDLTPSLCEISPVTRRSFVGHQNQLFELKTLASIRLYKDGIECTGQVQRNGRALPKNANFEPIIVSNASITDGEDYLRFTVTSVTIHFENGKITSDLSNKIRNAVKSNYENLFRDFHFPLFPAGLNLVEPAISVRNQCIIITAQLRQERESHSQYIPSMSYLSVLQKSEDLSQSTQQEFFSSYSKQAQKDFLTSVIRDIKGKSLCFSDEQDSITLPLHYQMSLVIDEARLLLFEDDPSATLTCIVKGVIRFFPEDISKGSIPLILTIDIEKLRIEVKIVDAGMMVNFPTQHVDFQVGHREGFDPEVMSPYEISLLDQVFDLLKVPGRMPEVIEKIMSGCIILFMDSLRYEPDTFIPRFAHLGNAQLFDTQEQPQHVSPTVSNSLYFFKRSVPVSDNDLLNDITSRSTPSPGA